MIAAEEAGKDGKVIKKLPTAIVTVWQKAEIIKGRNRQKSSSSFLCNYLNQRIQKSELTRALS